MEKTENRTALVTGAGTGLGKAIAISMANKGFTVILNGRSEEKLRKVEQEINKKNVIVVPGDVTDEHSVNAIRDTVLAKINGELDVLVNNVGGVSAIYPIAEMTFEQFQDTIDKNLTSQFLVTRAFLLALRKGKGGKIISVTSGMAHYYMEGFGGYSAGKAAVESLMKVVAEEEKDNGIEVHLFDPENVISESNPDGEKDPMELMGKLWGLINQ